jgi:hypothetical protein
LVLHFSDFLRFSTQFTINSQSTLLLELPFRREALRKNLPFAMWPLGGRPAQAARFRRARRRSWPGKGWGRVLGSLGFGLVGRTGGGAAPASVTLEAREGWPRRLPRAMGFRPGGATTVGVASRGASGGGEGLVWLGVAPNRSSPRLAKGADGGSVWAESTGVHRGQGPCPRFKATNRPP